MIRPIRLMTALACLSLMAACGTPQTGPREPSVAATLFENLRGGFAPKPAPVSAAALRTQITPALLSQIEGSVILSEVGGVGALMSEDGRNGDMVTYVDSGRIGLMLVDGIVVGTRGFGNDLMTADIRQTRAMFRRGGTAERVHRRLTGVNGIAATTYACRLSRAGNTVSESCTGPDAQFQNSYVLDKAGRVAASRQWLGPETGYVTIQRVR